MLVAAPIREARFSGENAVLMASFKTAEIVEEMAPTSTDTVPLEYSFGGSMMATSGSSAGCSLPRLALLKSRLHPRTAPLKLRKYL